MNKKLQKNEIEEIQKQIRALLVSAPNGQTLLELDKSFKEFMCRPIPFKQMGFEDATEFFQKNPNIGRLREIQGATFVYAVASEKDRHIAKLVAGQKKKASNFAKRAEKGVRFENKIPNGRENNYPGPNLTRYNSDYRVVRNYRYETRIIRRGREGPNYYRENKENVDRNLHSKFFKQKSAPDLRNGRELPKQENQNQRPVEKGNRFKSNTTFTIINSSYLPETIYAKIAHTRSPSNFYVHICDKGVWEKFEELEYNMESFYEDEVNNSRYKVALSELYIGKPCAVFFLKGTWRRGVILRINRMMRVYFVDYGQMLDTNLSEIRHINKTFLKLPAQAIPARLSSIKSFYHTWGQGAIAHFLKLVDSKRLKMKIQRIEDDNTLSCILKEDGERSINQQLLDRRFACQEDSDAYRRHLKQNYFQKVFLGNINEAAEKSFSDNIKQLEEMDEIMQFTCCLFVSRVKVEEFIIVLITTDFFNGELEEYIMEKDILKLLDTNREDLGNNLISLPLKIQQPSHQKVIQYMNSVYKLEVTNDLQLYPFNYLVKASPFNKNIDRISNLLKKEKFDFSYQVAKCKRKCIEQIKSLVNCGQTGLLDECRENLKTCIQLLKENSENIHEVDCQMREPPGLKRCEIELEKLQLASSDAQKMFEIQNQSKNAEYRKLFGC